MRQILMGVMLSIVVAGCGKKSDGPTVVPQFVLPDLMVTEGISGNMEAAVNISLNVATTQQVTINWATADGTARAGEDYIAATGQTVVFQPGETQKTFTIMIVGDDVKEADETFQIIFSGPVKGILMKSELVVTIRNDDTRIGFNNSGYDAPANYAGYNLAWSDEFNSTTLDAAAWSYESGDGCPGLCNWGNNELQYYTSSPNNLFFQDGKMIIEAKAETYGGKNYTSARIKTQDKKAFKFGRIDIRAILPIGKGIWPAFWLLPQENIFGTWPRSGEIDLMEYIGSEPSKVLGTIHYGPGPGSTYITRNTTLANGTFHDAFHVFSLEWENDQLRWYVDGNLYTTIGKADLGANNYPFNEQFYFIINLAVGGNLPGAPDASTLFPQHLIVDYIRIFQKQ